MFQTLENNPTVRERVLGLTAIGAILIGGAAGVDTMLTSGWQIGGDDANAAPVVYADSLPRYQDNLSQDWTTTRPRQVQLASVTADESNVVTSPGALADGTVSTASYQIMPTQPLAALPEIPSAQPAEQPAPASQSDSDRQFEAIENDVRQATDALEPDAKSEDDAGLSPPPT